MTISTAEALFSGPYNGDGVTASFDYDFKIYDAGELIVERTVAGVTTVLAEGTDYTVAGVGTAGGGSITLLDPATDAPTGATLFILPDIEFSQTRPFGAQSSTSLAELEEAFDKITSLSRQLRESTDRTLKLPPGSGLTERLPTPVTGATLAWGASGLVNGASLDAIAAAADNAATAEAEATAAAASAAAALAAENSLLEWQGAWVTATDYAPSDLVSQSGNTYVCLTTHTSGTFATDLGAGHWELFAEKGAPGAGSGDMLAANNLDELTDKDLALATLGGLPAASVLDEDDMATDSATRPPSQQSVKAYVDAAGVMVYIGAPVVVSSSTASIEFTGTDSAIYESYGVFISNLVGATDAAELLLQTSTDGGSSYETTGYTSRAEASGTATSSSGGCILATNIGAAAGEDGFSGTATIYSPHDSARKTHASVSGVVTWQDGNLYSMVGGGRRDTAEDNDAFRLIMSGGDIARCRVQWFGILKGPA